MKAIVLHGYGSPEMLSLAEVEKPVVKENEILVKVYAASMNAADWRIMRASPFLVRLMFGMFKPRIRILGADIAGRVEAVGSKVTQFKPGDAVYGDTFSSDFGGFAEYVCIQEKALAHKPANLSFEEAATVPLAGATALQSLNGESESYRGKKILINGASGGVGTFALQIAKAYGAEVTAVCSKSKMHIARSLGADHVIDYGQEDFTRSGKRYDLIIAVNGYQPISAYKRALNPHGTYLMVGGSGAQLAQVMLFGKLFSMRGNKKLTNVSAATHQRDLLILKEMLEAGKIKPVIDRAYHLSEVPEAMRYLEAGHAAGKIVINVSESRV
jgi:NADPH:quinone reductase-like Zn-dependent oxidoreductase